MSISVYTKRYWQLMTEAQSELEHLELLVELTEKTCPDDFSAFWRLCERKDEIAFAGGHFSWKYVFRKWLPGHCESACYKARDAQRWLKRLENNAEFMELAGWAENEKWMLMCLTRLVALGCDFYIA